MKTLTYSCILGKQWIVVVVVVVKTSSHMVSLASSIVEILFLTFLNLKRKPNLVIWSDEHTQAYEVYLQHNQPDTSDTSQNKRRKTRSLQRLYGKVLHCFWCFKTEILYLTKAVKEIWSLWSCGPVPYPWILF